MSRPLRRAIGGNWLASLAPNLRQAVLAEGRMRTLEAGAVLFRQGDAPSGLHAIVGGQMQVTGITSTGVEVLIALLRPGEWTGFLACLDGGPYAFTVSATESTEVFTVSLSEVRRLFLASVEGLQALMRPELVASRNVYDFLVENVTLTPMHRLARRLQDLASEAYNRKLRSNVITGVSQDQIAVSIMTGRQWTNHLLRQLQGAGIISIARGEIRICEPERLEALARTGEPLRVRAPAFP